MKSPSSIFAGNCAIPAPATAPNHPPSSPRSPAPPAHTPDQPEFLPQASPGIAKPHPTPTQHHPFFNPAASSSLPQWTPKLPADQRQSTRPSLSSDPTVGGPHRAFTTPPSTSKRKRFAPDHVPADSPPAPTSEPLHKRRRVDGTVGHSLDRFAPGVHSHNTNQPPSPLFFSHSRRPRPLPARFSSYEAASRMLSKTNGEESAIKTVTLARGTISSLSPSSGRGSERSSASIAASPDGRDRNTSLRLLGSVGIVELLEHDARPTFVVDIGDATNYTPGSYNLHIIFANAALRSSSKLWELVSGTTTEGEVDGSVLHALHQFKDWLLSSIIQPDNSITDPSPVEHGGTVWSCYTLRKRLRVASANPPHSAASPITSTRSSREFNLPSSVSGASSSGRGAAVVHPSAHHEPQDYFGNSIASHVEENTKRPTPHAHPQADVVAPPTDVPAQQNQTARVRPDKVGLPPLDGYPASFNNEDLSPPKDHEIGFFDWTRLALSASLPEHIQFARSIDWASTALGPIEFWSSDLRTMCNLIMASPHPAAMYWGDELVAIYNEAYIGLAGQKHPKLMGQSYKEAWAEIWDDVKDVFANARLTGQATMKDDDCLFMKRNGFLEETYFSWSIIPMVGEDGSVMGLYNPAFEKTRRKIAERRMLTLREVGERTATARDVKAFWGQVLGALTENEFDTPFVMLYSVSDDNDSDSSSLYSSSLFGAKYCNLEGSLGIPPNHPCAPEQIDLKEGEEGFGPVFREVMKTDKPVVISIGSGDLPLEMMEGLDWRGFGDPCRDVVVCPIHPTTGETILGFLVVGVNPRRPYDDDYNLFIQLLSRQLATSLASVVLFEEEIRRGQKAARLAAEDRFNLSEQLAARTQEAKDSETRFTRMAEYSPAGLFIADQEGRITYCNDTWYEISRVPRDPERTYRWIDYVQEVDQQMIRDQWKRLVENAESINVEFRFKATWEDRNGNKGDTWVLFCAFPEKYEDGMLKSVFGSITNISQQKWAEGFQKKKMEEAVELKRQQENFIDITSHEMRNPLSAILQCADEISTSLGDFRASGGGTISKELLNNSIDAAQTIALCAQHQKRIVDDVLTLSKLDSAMLMVTPVDSQPLQVVQRALKMFEGEVQTAGIQVDLVIDKSFEELKVDWVKLDPSRVLQVLINLTTNAIKFTTTESNRTIKVIVSATRQRPSHSQEQLVSFFPSRSKRLDQSLGPDWGTGEEIYLLFAVQDTGRGLTDEEKKLLFQRFSQASPRTHVQYGGSGLGLFISRELTELQGGEIGVRSEAGKGSTFAFYVKCRKTSAPKDGSTNLPIALARQISDAKPRSRDSVPIIKDFAEDKQTVAQTIKPPNSHLKVLIVEDNLVNQKVLQRQLHNLGVTVYVANHGGEALEHIKQSQYWKENGPDATDVGVVLMDKEMPIMDGLQCTSQIREWERDGLLRGHVPIIAVTANARSEQIAALLDTGMDDVVSKPFRTGDLIPKLEELDARYRKPSPALADPVGFIVPAVPPQMNSSSNNTT